ncbi:MAG: hypothetical protein AB1472_00525 [Candidatus Omnitrophota bacterium]
MFNSKKSGQSILEYVIVLAVVVVAIIFAAKKFIGPAISNGTDGLMDQASNIITDAADKFASDEN